MGDQLAKDSHIGLSRDKIADSLSVRTVLHNATASEIGMPLLKFKAVNYKRR